jgi:Undecaprenyl-phosphate galactose phosphotransferase WbaP
LPLAALPDFEVPVMKQLINEYSQSNVLDEVSSSPLPHKASPKPCRKSSLFLTGLPLLVSDTSALVLAPVFAYKLWAAFFNKDAIDLYNLWPALFLFWAIFWLNRLYPGAGMTCVEQLRQIARIISLIYLLLGTAVFLSKSSDNLSRGVFICAGIFSIFLVMLGRIVICNMLFTKTWWGVPVFILGAGKTAELVIRELRSDSMLGLKAVACFDDNPQKQGFCEEVPVVGPLSKAPMLAKELRIRYAIIAMPGVNRLQLLAFVEKYSRAFSKIILIPDLFGVSSLWVAARDLNGVLGLEIQNNLLIPINRWIKRGMDVVVAAIGLLFSMPVVAVCALWVKMTSPGKAFYFQDREGFGNKIIRIPKIRTMYSDSENILEEYLRSNPAAKMEWERCCKLKNDPRVLPVIGQFLRCTSLDELPQLWNILKGEMSLVGPRPFPSYHAEKFDREFRDLRRKVIPGLTGLWQVATRSNSDLAMQEKLDTYYIRNWSIWLDIYILGWTVKAVLKGDGAY